MAKGSFNSDLPFKKKRKTNKPSTANETVLEKDWIESFGMKNLGAGTRLLGLIVHVSSLRLKIALPNMMTGFCELTDISQSYRQYLEAQKANESEDQENMDFNTLEHLFQPGQYVLCSVKSVDTTPPFKVHLTIDPEVTQSKFSPKDLVPGMIISASVVSHEDHGIQFNFGVKNQTGFLPTAEAASHGEPLPVGRVILATVQKTNGRVSTLSLKKLATVPAPPILSSIDSLNPGLFVDAKVDNLMRNGVGVLVMGFFHCTISRLHLPHGDSDDWADHYPIGASLRARVIIVDVTALSKTIQLSLLPHLINLQNPPLQKFPVGHLFNKAVIVRAEGNHGLVCLGNVSFNSEETEASLAENSGSDSGNEETDVQDSNAMEVDSEGSSSDSDSDGDSDSGEDLDNELQNNSDAGEESDSQENAMEIDSLDLPRLYASANSIKDETADRDPLNLKNFRVGHTLPARVLGHFTMDGLIKVSLQPSVVKKDYPMFETLKIGQFISGTITVIKPGLGVAVRLSAHAPSAFIPILHASEFSTTDLEKKFTVGQKIDCRVLCLDSETSNIHLTCKKALMQSKLPLVLDFEDAAPGVTTHGVLLKVLKTGCVVGLWNRITAFIPLSEMFSGPAEDPTSSFRVGQVIQCTLKNVNPPKIIASLLDLSDIDLNAAAEQLESINVGDCTSGKVTTLTPDALVLTLDGGAKGILPFVHLSDHLSTHVSKLAKSFSIGSRISDVAVFAKQSSKRQVLVTTKPLLLSCAKSNQFQNSIADFKSGDIVPGVVNGVTERGVFVNFWGSISGLAEPAHSTNLNEQFRAGQTVLALVNRVESKRLSLSLNHDEIMKFLTPKNTLYKQVLGSSMITSFFNELNIVSTPKNKSKSAADNSVLCPGQITPARLVAKMPHGWTFKINEFDALMMGGYLKDLSLEVGSTLNCKILDFNPKLVDISARTPLMSSTSTPNSIPPVSKKVLARLTKSLPTSELFEAEIELVKEDYAIVSLLSLDRCLAFVPVKSYNIRSSPFKRFKVGQAISVRIVKAQSSEPRILAEIADTNLTPQIKTSSKIEVGATVSAKLSNFNLYNLELKVKIQQADSFGSIHATRVFDNYDSIEDPYQPFSKLLGSDLNCRILSLPSASNKSLELTALPSALQSKSIQSSLSQKNLNVGDVFTGFVKNASSHGVFVALTPKIHGLIRPIDLSSDYEIVKNYGQLFVPGMAIECRILKNKNGKIQLGLVRAKIYLTNEMSNVPAPFYNISEYQPGQVIAAQLTASGIHKAIQTGWFPVNISSGLASVHITDISDDFDTELSPQQVVKAFVLDVKQSDPSHIRLSLRDSCFSPGKQSVKDQEILSLSDLFPDQKIRGFVLADSSVTLGRGINQQLPKQYRPLPFGKFISLNVNNVNISAGQVELSPQSGKLKSSPNTLAFGDEVNCKITKIISTGLQVLVNGHFRGFIPNAQLPCLDGLDIKNKSAIKTRVASLYNYGMPVKGWFLKKEADSSIFSLRPPPKDVSINHDSDTEIQLDDENQIDPENIEPLDIDSGFQWSIQTGVAGEEDDNMDVSDLEAEVEASLVKPESKPKRSRRVAFEDDKTADVHAPEVASDFEKALLASPNSSFVWIQYMAYHLQQAAVAPARAVGLRALSTISVREEQERFNIHVALLNLEFKFGDAESLDKTFQSARIMVNDPKSLYFQLAKLYASSQRFSEAENTYRAATKKYSQMPEVWTALLTYFLERGQLEEARQTLQRSLQSLPKREHLPAIFQAAQLEFKYGEVERGRTLFEGILANNPKRLDIWSVYIDKEIQLLKKTEVSTDADIPRRLFRRVLKDKWSTHKMKFLFKKFLSFEKLYGQAHHVDHAKGLALAYVQQLKE